jgi:hypothetical protein
MTKRKNPAGAIPGYRTFILFPRSVTITALRGTPPKGGAMTERAQPRSQPFRLAVVSAGLLLAAQLAGQSAIKKPPLTVPKRPMPEVAVPTNCGNTPALPDIFLERVFVDSSLPSQGAKPNQNFTIAAILMNQGQCETGMFKVRILVDIEDTEARRSETRILGDLPVQSIQPQRGRKSDYVRVNVVFQTPIEIYSGYYRFYAIADPDNKVLEFDEDDNSTKGLYVEQESTINVTR